MKMKLENKEVNYSATVIRIHVLNELEGSDFLVGVPCMGMQALVSKATATVGELGILFPTECQLSNDFASNNNLYAHSNLNKDIQAKGYVDDNARVRAIKLRGHRSTALFMPLSSLSYLGIDTNELKEGDSFTHINGVEVCRKYVIKHSREVGLGNKTKGQTKRFIRIDNKTFPEHWDTDNFFRNEFKYKPDDIIIVTQKLHGTSGRFTNQRVLRKLTWKDKLAKWFGVSVNEYEYDSLAGSRRVIKDIKAEKDNVHFYGNDLWNEWLEKIKHVIPKNWVLYGEIVGYTGDKEIQPNYTYEQTPGTNQLYIYRITIVNEDGIVCDLSWDQIVEFCKNNGLQSVPELYRGKFCYFKVADYLNNKYNASGLKEAVALSKNSPCDEGACIRLEKGLNPYVTKAKSPDFLLHETKQLDAGVVDSETQESV